MVPEGLPGVGVPPRAAPLPLARVLAGLDGAARHATTWAVAAAVVCIAAEWPRLVSDPPLVLLDVAIAVGCVVAGNTPMEGGPRSVVPARLAAVAWASTGAEAWDSPVVRWVAVLAMAVFWSALARGCLQLGSRRLGPADRVGAAALAACWIALGAPGTSGVVPAALTVLAHAALVLRCRRNRSASRDTVPLAVAVAVAVAAVTTATAITVADPGAARPVTGVGLAATLLVALVPVGALAAGLRRRQVRAGVAELLMRTASPPSMESIRDAIAVALRDPSASIRYRAAVPVRPSPGWARARALGVSGCR